MSKINSDHQQLWQKYNWNARILSGVIANLTNIVTERNFTTAKQGLGESIHVIYGKKHADSYKDILNKIDEGNKLLREALDMHRKLVVCMKDSETKGK